MSGCALFKSAKHSNREVVYVGGGDNAGKTAEILDYTVTDQWEQGKFWNGFIIEFPKEGHLTTAGTKFYPILTTHRR